MELAAEIFKAYDIRGIVDKTLTPSTVELIGRALGSEALEAGESCIIIGRDGRLSGPVLSTALVQGINAAGCDTLDIGQVPTPLVYFATFNEHCRSGVAITGSHNPPDYNGLKMVINGTTLAGERIQNLKQRIINADLRAGAGKHGVKDIRRQYIERALSGISLQGQMKIVIDCGNGIAGDIAPELFRRLGCEVVELFCEVDGNFPNHHPDPSQLVNLQDLIKAVAEHQADIGLAFDGDGDRLGVVSPDGSVIWPDRQMILFVEDILQRQAGAEIIYDVKCTRNLPARIKELGGKATMWKTGHSFIKTKLKESGAALAGEMSGHIFFREGWYGFDDGLYAGIRLLEILNKRQASPQEIFAALPNAINTPELRLDMAEGDHYVLMEELAKKADIQNAVVNTIDGLRADFDDGFGLVRASNTTPTLIMRFEADSEVALQRIQTEFRQILNSTRPGLELPF